MENRNLKTPALYNMSGLAEYLGVHRRTICDWLHSEQFPAAGKTINGRRYWTAAQVNNFLEIGGKENG